jgi:hypothetical protein
MVSVDAVYQKVLAIANKEQRGYITPQEFNLFADHAQKDIFRQYFYDLDQVRRRPGNDYADVVALIEEKIARFEVYNKPVSLIDQDGNVDLETDTDDLYRLTMVSVGGVVAEKVSHKETQSSYGKSSLCNNAKTAGLTAYYTLSNHLSADNATVNRLKVYPNKAVSVSYIKTHQPPNWTYVIVGESAMFDDLVPGFRNFQIHESEETLLVTKILQLTGINIKDPSLVQLASQEEVKKIQQEKQ